MVMAGCSFRDTAVGAGGSQRSGMASRRLPFRVHRCSSHQANYVPENVMVDKPTDQSSRWSTINNTPPQFLVLKLNRPAIVKSITFGKYDKTHVCNLKKFTIEGGMHDETFTELLSAGLENNNAKETFSLRHTTKDGQIFPVQYISIVPHLSWGPSFNFSIWYLELHGIDDPPLIRNILFQYNLFAEKETIRLCLKHFRQQKYVTAFNDLQKQTGVSLEAPQLSHLYELLVERGDFEASEMLLQKSAQDGFFNWYASQQPYVANWSNVSPCSPELAAKLTDSTDISPPMSSPSPPLTSMSPIRELTAFVAPSTDCPQYTDSDRTRPGQRGGHQMCIDPVTNTIYLFGGWDGENDLSDLWSYNISDDKWTLIFKRSEQFDGPRPRSCHKMVLDSVRRQIFVLGRYLDTKYRSTKNIKSDMYVFDINECRWWRISDDTAANGGPPLIFDHQMCIDTERHIIYVFGGRVLSLSFEGEDFPPQYSGLYAYYICEDRWQLLLADTNSIEAYQSTVAQTISSRAGHSMLYHPVTHTLYIFGGQRNKEHQADLLAVRIKKSENDETDLRAIVQAVCTAAPPRRAPPTGFTQRATIDPDLNEIYVLSGLSKEKDKRISNSLWVFSITSSQWSCIYKNDNQGHKYWCKMQATEPCPRFAHQLVYDPINKVHYLFGGNPGKASQPYLRLDDFWLLKLSRVNSTSALWRARLQLRRLRFQELAEGGKPHEALTYLQTNLYQATDHSDPEQERQFQLLASMLFTEKLQDITFNPPLDGSLSMAQAKSSSAYSDPELHEDLQQSIRNNRMNGEFPQNSYNTAAEQQKIFAAVLGMDSIGRGSSDTGVSFDISNKYFSKMGESSEDISKEYSGKEVDEEKWNKWEVHYRRCQLFQQLSEYYPQHMVQPKKNLTDYIIL